MISFNSKSCTCVILTLNIRHCTQINHVFNNDNSMVCWINALNKVSQIKQKHFKITTIIISTAFIIWQHHEKYPSEENCCRTWKWYFTDFLCLRLCIKTECL